MSKQNIKKIIDPEWCPITAEMLKPGAMHQVVLQQNPLFENLGKRDWWELTNLFHDRNFQSGEMIFQQDTPGMGMYVIIHGTVKIVSERGEQEIELAVLKDGEFFGEMSLIDETARSASAVVSEKTHAIAIFRPQLEELLNRRPKLGNKILKRLSMIISHRLRIANQLISEYSQNYQEIDEP